MLWVYLIFVLKAWWYGTNFPATINAPPQRPDFPLDSTSFSGASLFGSEPWTEEEVVVLQHKIKNIFRSSSSRSPSFRSFSVSDDISVVHSCVLRPTEQAIFNPLCPVIQTAPHIKVQTDAHGLAEQQTSTTDLTIWQGRSGYGWSDARRLGLLLATPFVSFLVLLLLSAMVACSVSCLVRPWVNRQKRTLEETIIRQDKVLRSQGDLIGQLCASKDTIDKQWGLINQSNSLLATATQKVQEQLASLSGYAAKVTDLETALSRQQESLGTHAKVLAETEARVANLTAALEQARLADAAKQGRILRDQDKIGNLEDSVKARDDKIQEQEKALAAASSEARSRDDKIKEQQKALADLNKAVQSRDTKAQEQEKELAGLKASVKDREATIREQKNALGALELAVEAKDEELIGQKIARLALEESVKLADEGRKKVQRELDQVKQELKARAAPADGDESSPSFAQTRVEPTWPMAPVSAPALAGAASVPVAVSPLPVAKDHIFSVPKVKNQGHTAGALMQSKYATTPVVSAAAAPAAPATSPSPVVASLSPSPAVSSGSGLATTTPTVGPVAQQDRDHIFSVPKVKNLGHSAGDLLSSRYATAAPTAPAGPRSGSGSGSVGSGSRGARHSVPGAPTRPKTRVERVIDSQAVARGLPVATPNRPKTQAERAAESK